MKRGRIIEQPRREEEVRQMSATINTGELKLRRCEVLTDIEHSPTDDKVSATWKDIPFSELKKGDIFRLFDAPGGAALDVNLRIWENGSSVCVALGDATPIEPKGNFVVQTIELGERWLNR